MLPGRFTEAGMRELAGAALVVDIHASNVYLREIPQVRINQDSVNCWYRWLAE